MREKHLNEVEAQRAGRALAPTDHASGRESSAHALSDADHSPDEIKLVYVDPLGGRGGPPRSLAVIASSSAYRAHYLAAPGAFLEFARDRADHDSLVLELPSSFRQRWSKLRAAARCVARLRTVDQRLIWVVNGLTGVWIAAPTARLRREPVVLMFRDSASPGRRASRTMRQWQRTGLRVYAMAPSNYGMAALESCMRMTPLGVVPNAVARISERERQLTSTRSRVGWIGSRRRVKGLDVLIQIAGHLTDLTLDWLVFGTGLAEDENRFPYVDECRELAHVLGVSPAMSWRGYVSSDEIMREIDVLVVTSERESCSRAILEALASGIPVIAADVGGNSEILTGSLAAGLFDRADPSAAAAIIRRLTTDRSYYRSTSRCALGRAKAFEARKMAALFDQTLLAIGERERI